MKYFFLLSLLLVALLGKVESFVAHKTKNPLSSSSLRVSLSFPPTPTSATSVESSSSSSSSPSSTSSSTTEIKKYKYDGWNLTYRYKAASPGFENASPILLIHPVGIGLSSWFWERFMAEWTGPALYAPNLIGCGVSEGGDLWDPEERGLSFPLGWAKGCEALMKSVVVGSSSSSSSPLSAFSLFNINNKNNKSRKWTVMSQGGLAPVAVMMAARNSDMIDNLVLASPPTWKDMTTAVPEVELSRNYNFLRNPVWGRLAFNLLESRGAIEFFSNQFLFSKPCDTAWLDKAEHELGLEVRPPVICFNAGFCQHRSFEEELRALPQSTLIIAGDGDKRPREEYTKYMKECRLQVLPGLNVLPWESPSETVKALTDFF